MSDLELPDWFSDDLDGWDHGPDEDDAVPAYKIAGPTIDAFHSSDLNFRAIMGPVGSGKTTATQKEHFYRACAVPRSEKDGIRRYRGTLFRKTYRQHEAQTIPEWFQNCVPKSKGKFRGGANGDPGRHQVTLKIGHDDYVLMDMWFLAIGDHNPEDVLQGHLTTTISGHELTQMGQGLIDHGLSRLARYPSKSIHYSSCPENQDPFWSGFWGDFNAPDEDLWLAEFMRVTPNGWKFFTQPGGLDELAENLQNLPGGRNYYHKMIAGKADWWVRRFVHNRIGFSREGKPVYMHEYDDTAHVALQTLMPTPGITVHIGLDGGRHPAAAALQRTPMGRVRLLRELAIEGSAPTFGRVLREWVAEHFHGCPLSFCADETTNNANAEATDDIWLEVMEDILEHRITPITNDWSTRYNAMVHLLLDRIDHQTPTLEVCPTHMPIFRRAMNSAYAYPKLGRSGKGEVFDKRPVKTNPFADVVDCAYYAILNSTNRFKVFGGRGRNQETVEERDFDPLG